MSTSRSSTIEVAVLLASAPACYADGKPSFIRGEILKKIYDGDTDNLLTAGLGATATGQPLSGTDRANHRKIENGIQRILADGHLHGIPSLIATGRADANLAPNHTSRAYYGLNKLVEGGASNLRYYEVTNAHHLDTFNQFAGFNDKFVPLHFYFVEVMNLMFDHLKNGASLPPSQVVGTIPRGAGTPVPDITSANVPPIEQMPDEDALITFDENVLTIPE